MVPSPAVGLLQHTTRRREVSAGVQGTSPVLSEVSLLLIAASPPMCHKSSVPDYI